MSNDRNYVKHPAFGLISAGRVSGNQNLFMVDYPQDHYIRLTISNASLRREYSNDYTYEEGSIAEVYLSEVQWARLLSSMNSQGVPCTLRRYWSKEGFVAPDMPDTHVGKKETFIKEVQETADDAAKSLADAIAAVNAALEGKTIKKGDMEIIKEHLRKAKQELDANLPFVVKQAEEAIETAVEAGKAEISAHAEFALVKVGERALGEKMHEAIKRNELAAIGQTVLDALSDKTKE